MYYAARNLRAQHSSGQTEWEVVGTFIIIFRVVYMHVDIRFSRVYVIVDGRRELKIDSPQHEIFIESAVGRETRAIS